MRTPNPDIPSIPNTPEVGTQLSFGPAQTNRFVSGTLGNASSAR
jgi:hypothetical protein